MIDPVLPIVAVALASNLAMLYASRTQEAERARARAARTSRKSANRRKTRAYQDAAMLVRGNGPKAGSPFLGSANVKVGREPVVLAAMERRTIERGVVERTVLDRHAEPEAWKRRRARNVARRIAETGMGLRIRRVTHLCRVSGALSVAVEPRGTTRECSACGEDVPKNVGERLHVCPRCGLTADRDVNAAVNVVGRARREFRSSADPSGRIAAAAEVEAQAAAQRRRKLEMRAKGGRTRGKNHPRGRSDSRLEHQGELH
jgi:transposase